MMIAQQPVIAQSSISQAVCDTLEKYLESMPKEDIRNLYAWVVEPVEESLFNTIMLYCKLNQVKASKALGLSRGTLRKKLKHYFADKYGAKRNDK